MQDGNDLSGIVHTIQELEETRNQYFCDNHALQDAIAEMETDLDEMEKLHRDNQVTINENEATLQPLQREHKNLLNLIQTKDMEIAELRGVLRDLEDTRREHDNLFKDLSLCHENLCKLKEYIIKLEDTIHEKDQTIARQEQLLAQLHNDLQDFKREVDCLTEENARQVRLNEECKKRLEEALAENDRLNEKLRQVEMARQKLEECLHKNQAYLKQLKMELAREQANNAKLQSKINELEEELAKARKEIAQLKDEIAGLNELIDERHSDLTDCRAELKRKTDEFENYKKTIEALKQKIMTNRNNNLTCSALFGASARDKSHGTRAVKSCLGTSSPHRYGVTSRGSRGVTSCMGARPTRRSKSFRGLGVGRRRAMTPGIRPSAPITKQVNFVEPYKPMAFLLDRSSSSNYRSCSTCVANVESSPASYRSPFKPKYAIRIKKR